MTDILDLIKHDFLASDQIDQLIADPESTWVWTEGGVAAPGRIYEVTMEVRDKEKSFGTIHTADDITFQVYHTPAAKVKDIEAPIPVADRQIDYRFAEGDILAEIKEYIDSTYSKHYATNGGFQATDAIIATGNGLGFCVGNILKYAWRLGKKDGFNKLDIMKVIHYSIILMFIMKKEIK